jgi:hypothetical protein
MTTNQYCVQVVEDQQSASAVHQWTVVMVINERDSELVHPIGRGLCLGNLRHSNELDTFALSPRWPSLKNNSNHLSNRDWHLDDGHCCFKISRSNALPVGQGRRGEEVDMMEVQCLVPDQLNDVKHHLKPLREMAHHIDRCHVENLRSLVVKQGNSATGAVDGLDGNWA